MPIDPAKTNSDALRQRLRGYLDGDIPTAAFCRDVEAIYNDSSGLLDPEEPIFSALFDVVSWFSPFPEERLEVPHLRNEDEVRAAAIEAQARLDAL